MVQVKVKYKLKSSIFSNMFTEYVYLYIPTKTKLLNIGVTKKIKLCPYDDIRSIDYINARQRSCGGMNEYIKHLIDLSVNSLKKHIEEDNKYTSMNGYTGKVELDKDAVDILIQGRGGLLDG